MRNYFPKPPSDAPLHTLSKLYYVPVDFVAPPPSFEAVYCLFAVAEGWLLLDIEWFVLFLMFANACFIDKNRLPYLSTIFMGS